MVEAYKVLYVILLVILMTTCDTNLKTFNLSDNSVSMAAPTIVKSDFGVTDKAVPVEKYTLANGLGMEIEILTFGGIITSWTAPDKEGNYQNIVLGLENLNMYLKETPYFGALIGRYGNRIADGQFELEGRTYTLETNNGQNHLHGGLRGFDKVVWEASSEVSEENVSLTLTYTSKDGEGGYPGTLITTVIYTLAYDNSVEVLYHAVTDQTTVVNMTQHSYFNLSGDFTKDILDHRLEIDADYYLPVDEGLIPLGQLATVDSTPFNFKNMKSIGRDIDADDIQLQRGGGFDHCWVLNGQGTYRKVAAAYHPGTGRLLEVFSSEPGIQFYTGNFLDNSLPIPGGGTYGKRTGFCLETQHYPDSPNQESFPSVVLRPREEYKSKTTFRFSIL